MVLPLTHPRFRYAVCLLLGVFLTSAAVQADIVQLQASRDNTLYDINDGLLSNGGGDFFFAGMTAIDTRRRGIVAFDHSALPAGATILSASVTLSMSKTITGVQMVELHRVLSDWGEGATNAPGEEGIGAPAQTGDVTWQHTFFPGSLWAAEGGDFDPTASASQIVSVVGFYTWASTPGLVADVQAWVDDPASAYGWLVLGNEGAPGTAKRFDSSENLVVARRPVLTVEFMAVPPPSGSIPDGAGVPGTPLTASLASGGQVRLDWALSCVAADDDYIVYEGALGGSFTSHLPVTCSTGGALTFTFSPGAPAAYFLVVPRSLTGEGSHGRNHASVERSQGAGPCLPRLLGGCAAPVAGPGP